MENRTREELLLIALHLDIPDILKLCKTSKIVNKKLCQNADFWRRIILRDFPDFKFETLLPELNSLFPKDVYTLLYTIKVWKLEMNVNELYFAKEIELDERDIHIIPDNLKLPHLERLNLDNNHIKNIPTNSYFPKLTELRLSSNEINKFPTFSNFSKLIELRLGGNNIIEIPQDLYIPNLKMLHLSYNKIITIPTNLNLPKLENIVLSYNEITSIPEKFPILSNLKEMNLSNNKISDIPENLTLPKLKYLVLNNNYITKLPKKLNLSNLKTLFLSGNPIKNIRWFKWKNSKIDIFF
jgi:Leucine-rich repeat (LRR) protein